MSAEVVAIRLGTALVGRAAHLLLAKQQGEQDRHSDMEALIRRYIPGLRPQRSVQRQFEQIADSVAERLEPMLAHEFRGMDEGEHTAVVNAVVDTFDDADLSDAAIFASNADSAQLARRIREAVPPPVGLSAVGSALYDQLVAECCDCYVQIVRHLPVFTERAVAELLSRVDQLGKELEQVLEQMPKRSLYAPEGSDLDAAFRREYLALVSGTLDEVELFSFAVEQPLRTKLSVAYVSLRVTQGAKSPEANHPVEDKSAERSTAETWATGERASGRGRVEAALSRKSRVLIRGEAGSGKTTLLRWLAVTAARASFTDELAGWNGLVPVLLRLRSYAGRELPKLNGLLDDAAGLLTSHMPNGWIDRLIAHRQVLLLIDGVDEIVPADRQKVREWINGLLHTYPQTRVVVTSRPAAAHQNWLESVDFAPVELERMTPTDLTAFIRQWHRAVAASGQQLPCAPEALPDYERALVASIQDRRHLHALAANPLLAAMLCALHLSRNRQLPRNRMELYQIAVELLVRRRDTERNIPAAQEVSLSLTDMLTLLRDLAWRLSDNNLNELDIRKATGYVVAKVGSMRHLEVDPYVVMNYLLNRSGILRSPADGRIDFVHRTFQEYLAAAEAAAQDRIGNLVGRAHLDVWRDTIIMAAGHANRSQRHELITGMLDRTEADSALRRQLTLLAASCLETIDSISDDLAESLDQAIAELVPPRNHREASSLAHVGEPILRHLPSSLDELSSASAAATIRSAALIGGPTAMRLLSGYARDERPEVVHELREVWPACDPVEYAEQVLANGSRKLRRSLWLHSPGQWTPAAQLDDVEHITVDYPASIDALGLSELPPISGLDLYQLSGVNDLSALADLRYPTRMKRLILNSSRARATVRNLESLAALESLTSLFVTGWRRLPPLSADSLPSTLRTLSLGRITADYDLTAIVDHELDHLILDGEMAHAALATLTCVTRLKHVTLTGCDLTDGFHKLAAVLPQLHGLGLHGVVLPYDLITLADFPALTDINLTACTGPALSAVNVASIPQPSAQRQLTITIAATDTTEPIASRDRILYRQLRPSFSDSPMRAT